VPTSNRAAEFRTDCSRSSRDRFRDMVSVRIIVRVRVRPKQMNWPVTDGLMGLM